MNTEEKHYIQYERIGLLLVPGFMQIENKQKFKGIFIILLFVGVLFLTFFTSIMSYSIFLGYIWAFGVIDSLSIMRGITEKRTSRTVGALDLIDKPDDLTDKKEKSDTYEIGEIFEEFVKNKFNKRNFTIVKQTVPVPKAEGFVIDSLRIENNLDPDFTFRYRPNLEKFAVETKWRSSLGKYELIYPKQMARYKQFEEEEKIPVYIVIGLGGTPDNPNQMFLLPLKAASSHELTLEFLLNYEVDPNRNFKWRPGSVVNSGYLFQMSDKSENLV